MGIFLCVPTLAPGMHSPHGRQLQSQAIVICKPLLLLLDRELWNDGSDTTRVVLFWWLHHVRLYS